MSTILVFCGLNFFGLLNPMIKLSLNYELLDNFCSTIRPTAWCFLPGVHISPLLTIHVVDRVVDLP